MKKPHVTRTTNKDHYETPPELFNKIDKVVKFTIDLAASVENSLCDSYTDDFFNYVSLADDPDSNLINEVGWLNPPFSQKNEFLAGVLRLTLHFREIWVLVPNNARESAWWKEYVWGEADEIISLSPRVQFLIEGERPKNAETGKESGAGFSVCLIIYRRRLAGVNYGAPRENIWNWQE